MSESTTGPDRLRRPNVIWVFGDQHRGQALSHRGDPSVHTPHIDRLARDGVRFDAAVAGAPWCTPFRAALLTGMYPHQNGCTQTPSPLDPSIPTLAQPFKDAGYHTAYVGKWHLGGSNAGKIIPPDRRGGFDHWLGYENNNAQYHTFVHGSGADEPFRLPGYETDALTDLFIDHLREHTREDNYAPFFGVLSVQPPHSPYTAPGSWAQRHHPAKVQLRPNVPRGSWIEDRARIGLAGYYAMIENLDHNLGRLRDALQLMDADRQTIILFFSDHGDMHGSHGQFAKSSPWEESIRIPLIVGSVTGAGQTRAESACDAVVNHVDITATTLGLCGIDPLEQMVGHDYRGRILAPKHPNYKEPGDEPASAYCQQIPRKQHKHSVNVSWRAVVTRDGWKYAAQPGHHWLMHDLNADPYEQANFAHDNAFKEQRERLHAELAGWIERTGDAFELPALD